MFLSLFHEGNSSWILVEEQKECYGAEIYMGRKESVDECANSCRGLSTMFIVGTTDYGAGTCGDKKCSCFCETGATIDGTCKLADSTGYRVYKFHDKGMRLLVHRSNGFFNSN